MINLRKSQTMTAATYNGPADHPLTTDAPHAWVGCLACYNDGRLTGDWVDGIYAADFVPCTRTNHDEWWVMDFENYGDALKGETSPGEAQAIAEAIAELAEWDNDRAEAFRAWLDHEGFSVADWETHADDFDDRYAGEYDSIEDYAYAYLDESGMLDELPAWAQVYGGTLADSFAHDLRCGGEVYSIGRFMFRSY